MRVSGVCVCVSSVCCVHVSGVCFCVLRVSGVCLPHVACMYRVCFCVLLVCIWGVCVCVFCVLHVSGACVLLYLLLATTLNRCPRLSAAW